MAKPPLTKEQFFRPSATQEMYAYMAAKLGKDATQRQIAASINLAPETVSRWKQKNPEFDEWLEERVPYYSADMHALLEAAAIAMMKKDHRYWESLNRKYSYLSKEQLEDHKEQKLVIYLGGNDGKQKASTPNSEPLPEEKSE